MPRPASSAGNRLRCTALLVCSLVAEYVVWGIEAPCLIGDRDEVRLKLNSSSESLCCAAAEVYFARRQGGFCPKVQSARPLPFEVSCAVEHEMHGAYVPTAATAQAAERLLCTLENCEAAAAEVVVQAFAGRHTVFNKYGEVEHVQQTNMMLTRPQCSKQDRESNSPMTSTTRILIAVFVVLVALVIVALFHCVVTPRWIRSHAPPCAEASPHLSVLTSSSSSYANAEVHDVAFDFEVANIDDAGESSVSTKSVISGAAEDTPTHLSRQPTPPPPQPLVEPPLSPAPPHSAVRPRPQPLGAPSGEQQFRHGHRTSLNAEAMAAAILADARGRCRAHIILLCGAGIVATFARLALSASTLQAGPAMVVVLVFCVLQLGILARASWKPLDVPLATKEDSRSFLDDADGPEAAGSRSCSYATLIGDLRLYSGATLICEILVLLVAVGVIAENDVSYSTESDDDGVASTSLSDSTGTVVTPLRSFVLHQLALSLVLMRLYTVWLAHSLHKLRTELTFLVLPESPKAKKAALERQRSALSVLAPAWEPWEPLPSASSNVPAAPKGMCGIPCLQRARVRAAVCAASAISLVVAAAAVGLWRAHEHTLFERASSCHTAADSVDFCVPVSYIGLFEVMKSQEECCRDCDLTGECHAWRYEAEKGGGGRCWKIHFEEAPCSQQPSHPDCRCTTQPGRVVGYRPDGANAYYS